VESTTNARESALPPVTGTALKEDNISLKPGVCKLAMLCDVVANCPMALLAPVIAVKTKRSIMI